MRSFFACTALLLACGTPSPRPSTPTPAPSATAEPAAAPSTAPAAPPAAAIPTTCAPGFDVCVPDSAFVKRLCDGSFPDVALMLMAKDAPFARMYMKGDVDGWNADGGGSARARLRFDEEMLVLKRRAPPANGIVVGAGTGYLVMRWDGNCYTLDDLELTAKKPPTPKHAPIPWRLLTEPTRNALLKSAKVLAAYQRRGKECKGVVTGEVSLACEQADTALSAAVVQEMRGGMRLPLPERLP